MKRQSQILVILALALGSFVFPLSTIAAPRCAALFNHLQSLSETLRMNNFAVERGLEKYADTFGPEFQTALYPLRNESNWVDFGAGQGRAALEYLKAQRGHSAHAYGIVFKKPGMDVELLRLEREMTEKGLYTSLEGRLLEDIPVEELPLIDVGTDFYGPLSYTGNLSFVLNRYLHLMRSPQTSRLFLVSPEPSVIDRSWDASNTTFIVTKTGEVKTVTGWLRDQKGIQIKPRMYSGTHANFELIKEKDEVQLPRLEFVLSKEFNFPPALRIFREPGANLDPQNLLFFSNDSILPFNDTRLAFVGDLLREHQGLPPQNKKTPVQASWIMKKYKKLFQKQQD